MPFQISPMRITKNKKGRGKLATYYLNIFRIISLFIFSVRNSNGKLKIIRREYANDATHDISYYGIVCEKYEESLDEEIDHKISPLLNIMSANDQFLRELFLEAAFSFKIKRGFVIFEYGIHKKGELKTINRSRKLKDILK